MMNEVWQIPDTWAWTQLKHVGEIVAGGTPSTKEPSYWGTEVNWVSPADLTGYASKYIGHGTKGLSKAGLENSSAKLMPAGSVHFSSRAPIGYVVISSKPLATNQGFKSLIPADGVFNEYVYYYLKGSKQLAERRASGTTFLELSGTAFGLLPLPLPPENEQHRIVAKIEELFSELDKGVESLKTAREQLTVYRQAVLNSAASGQLLVERGLRKAQFGSGEKSALGAVVQELGQGWSPRCHNHPSPDHDTWGVIKTTAIQHLAFDASENKELPTNLTPRPHLAIQNGDILITRAGPRKRVGVACLVRSCRPRIMLCDKAYRVRVDSKKMLPEFLEMLLNSPRVLQTVEELKSGINDSGVNLTQDRFLSLQIFAPSLEEQEATLAELSAVLSNIEYAEAQVERALHGGNMLRQCILKKAFSGQLAAQDASDEPASVLLERIKPEKVAKVKGNKNNKNNKRKDAA